MGKKEPKITEGGPSDRILSLARAGIRLHKEAGADELQREDTLELAAVLFATEALKIPLPALLQHGISFGQALEREYAKSQIIRAPGVRLQ